MKEILIPGLDPLTLITLKRDKLQQYKLAYPSHQWILCTWLIKLFFYANANQNSWRKNASHENWLRASFRLHMEKIVHNYEALACGVLHGSKNNWKMLQNITRHRGVPLLQITCTSMGPLPPKIMGSERKWSRCIQFWIWRV